MPELHSKYSPSSSSRWLACPGSLLIEAPEDQSSQYAAQGTAAHSLAHRCLLLGVDPESELGKVVEVDGYSIEIDQEMIDGVHVYIDFIESTFDLGEDSDTEFEVRVDHSEIENFGGTIDCASTMHIVDFKYGAGVAVEAIENEQLGCYALLYCENFNYGHIADVELTIVQPRAHHEDGPIRSWLAPAEWLQDLKERIQAVASGSRDSEIHAGSHCRWCPHKAQCPELYEMTIMTAKKEFAAPEMTPEVAAKVLNQSKAIKSFLEAVEEWVHGQLDKGVAIPGYKLVDTFHNRQFAIEESDIVRRCRNAKFGKKQIYKTELMSPAQLEKVVGKDLVASMVERPHKGTTVVPVSDKRPAVARLSAKDEFANVSLED